MRIESTAKSLFTALSRLRSAIPKRPLRPILSHMLINAGEDGVTAQGTDLELYIRVAVPDVAVPVVGTAAVPYDPLLSALGRMGDDAVAIEAGSGEVTIVSPSAKLRLSTQDAKEFPEFQPSAPTDHAFTLGRADVEAAVRKVKDCVHKGAHRYAIIGAQMRGSSKGVELTGIDGAQLSTVLVRSRAVPTFEAIVPVPALVSVVGLPESDEIDVCVSDSRALFSAAGCSVSARLFEGSFPPWDTMLPERFEAAATVNRKALLDAIGLVGVVLTEESSTVVLSTDGDTLHVAASEDAGSAGSAGVDVPMTDVRMSVEGKFRAPKLRSMLTCADAEELALDCHLTYGVDATTQKKIKAAQFYVKDASGWRYVINGTQCPCQEDE